MRAKFIRKLLFILLTGFSIPVYALDFESIQPANPFDAQIPPITMISAVPKRATLTHNDIRNQYIIAYDRFIQSNVKSSYRDFKILIDTMVPNDYAYMQMAEKMADLGFFNLSQMAASKIEDRNLSDFLIGDIKSFYFPVKKLKPDVEIYLGEVYSNIVYNAQSREAAEELIKNINLLADNDYANYVAALGFLKSSDIVSAEKYIDTAIKINPQNLNYFKLKAEIQSLGKKPQNALKTVAYIKSQKFYTTDFTKKINSIEQYILYKTQKNNYKKMYHLGHYYYFENEPAKAVRTLQGALSSKKKQNKDVYALLSRIFYDMNDFEKAQDCAKKALKLDGNNPDALLVLGDLKYRTGDYKYALKYYKDAENNRSSSLCSIRIAQTYEQLGKDKKAYEIYEKVLKLYSDAYIAYYKIALKDKSKESAYLKKALSINMYFKDAWIDLGRIEIARENLTNAKKYLNVANYIDENDFRYYYYQGLIYKKQGYKDDAISYFKKSLVLNPEYQPAKEELNL